MSNLKRVIHFEIIRNLKKPTFWIAALLLPLLLIGYIAFAGFSGQNIEDSLSGGTDTSDLALGLYDGANFLDHTTLTHADGSTQDFTTFTSTEQGIAALKNDDINVLYVLPQDFAATATVQIYAKSAKTSIFTNYEAPIRTLLAATSANNVAPIDASIISGQLIINTTNFTLDDTAIDPAEQIGAMIIPGVALALFYILICLFGNRLTTAMVEEKENRISEMILTSMSPKDLIVGKIISLIILGFIQLAALIIPMIIIAIFGFESGIIPSDLPIDFNPYIIISSLLLLIFSYFLFTALCVTIGTLVPTAKDASSFSSFLIILVILPLFFMGSFLSDTPDAMTYIFSYFPPSAPIALMFRNLFGNLPPLELILGLCILAISSAIIVRLAVYIFTRNAIEFNTKINLQKLLSSPRKSWKK